MIDDGPPSAGAEATPGAVMEVLPAASGPQVASGTVEAPGVAATSIAQVLNAILTHDAANMPLFTSAMSTLQAVPTDAHAPSDGALDALQILLQVMDTMHALTTAGITPDHIHTMVICLKNSGSMHARTNWRSAFNLKAVLKSY